MCDPIRTNNHWLFIDAAVVVTSDIVPIKCMREINRSEDTNKRVLSY